MSERKVLIISDDRFDVGIMEEEEAFEGAHSINIITGPMQGNHLIPVDTVEPYTEKRYKELLNEYGQ